MSAEARVVKSELTDAQRSMLIDLASKGVTDCQELDRRTVNALRKRGFIEEKEKAVKGGGTVWMAKVTPLGRRIAKR